MSSCAHVPADPRPDDDGLFRALVEQTSDILLVLDAEGLTRYVSPSVTRVLGYDAARLLGRDAFDFVHPDDAAAARAAFARNRHLGGARQPVSFRLRHQDGTWRWFEIVADNCLHDPAVRGFVVSARDVTRRVEAEAALQQAATTRARLAAIVDSSQDAIIAEDLDGVITDWNPGAEGLYGYTAEEMVGCSLAVLIPPERPVEMPDLLDRLRRGERVECFQTVRVRRDGQRLDVSVSISPIRDAQGRVVGAASIHRDITERTRVERERADLYRALLEREQQLHEVMERVLLDREDRLRQADPKLARLSPREREVLALVAEGKTNREIGQALGCATLTARNHVEHVLTKLGVGDRTRAAVWAAQRGLIGLVH